MIHYAPPARRKQPEKQIQREIIQALTLMGCRCDDMSQPRSSMMPRGLPDLYIRHPRWQIHFWLEVKTAAGRVSPNQLEWHRTEAASGGKVYVVRNVREAMLALQAEGAPVTIKALSG